jgi:hypothetical protein
MIQTQKLGGDMADRKALEDRLKEIGCNFRVFARPELKELANVLLAHEVVEHCVIGTYEGGFALLVATDQRVLLIDKKPLYLTLEDTRYDMITEVDYNHLLVNANMSIRTPNKSLRFVAYNQARLRKLFHFVQTRVMEIRQHYQQAASQAAQAQQYITYASQLGGAPMPQQLVSYEAYPVQPTIAIGPSVRADAQVAFADMPSQQVLLRQPVGPISSGAPTVSPAYAHPMVAPIIGAYTRLPMMSRQRRFLGSRAVNAPTMYIGQQ